MNTFLYRAAEEHFIDGTWDWDELPVYAAFVSANYAPDPSHETLEDIDSNALVRRDLELTRLRFVNDLAKGVIAEVEAFTDGREVIGLLLYTLGDTDAESELIYYSADGAGFPWTPSGFDYSVAYRQEDGGFFGFVELERAIESDNELRVTEGGDTRILEESGIDAFAPVLSAELGDAKPRIYAPKENLTVRGSR